MGRIDSTKGSDNDKVGAFSLWAIGVSLVISGESFGWNIGWRYTCPLTFFILFGISAMMYYVLVNCLVELACIDPILALVELMIYQTGVIDQPSFWMFLAIEGLSLFTNKVRKDNFKKCITLGYFT